MTLRLDRNAPNSIPGARLCLDRRLLDVSGGTGVATYAANLERGATAAGYYTESLQDAGHSTHTAVPRTFDRVARWGAALQPWPRCAERTEQWGRERVSRDVFRIAQVHFDAYGRCLQLRSRHRPDLMHWSYPLPLHFQGLPNLVTVHDLIPALHPELTPVSRRRSLRMLRRLRHEATHVVTVSEASRREIIAELGWPEDRVTNTYQSVEAPAWTPEQAEAATREAAASSGLLRGSYFLHVGTIERRKNIGRLIAAFRHSGVDAPLVLAGPDGWHAAEELRAAGALPPGRLVRIPWTGRVALMGLMRGARALLAPSLAEGFGLPAAEAMMLGIPVMTSAVDISGVPGACAEIAADGALLIDPRDIGAMARAIASLDADADLRGRLVVSGAARARLFAREAYAGRLRALYASVLARAGAGSPRRDA